MIEGEIMKKKILFVNDEMAMGGVARILIGLLSKIDLNKYDVDVLILHPQGELMNEFPSGIKIIKSHPFFSIVDMSFSELLRTRSVGKIIHKLILVLLMKTSLIVPIIKLIRKKLIKRNYDVEFSAKEGFCTIFVSCGNSEKKINWVQVDYGVQNYSKNHMGLMKRALQKIDLNIASSEKVAESYKVLFNVERIQVIHNFIDVDAVYDKLNHEIDLKSDDGVFTFITVARFHPQKAVDRLIRGFAHVHQNNVNTKLIIIGDGEQRSLIIDLIHAYKLENCVELLGIKQNPYPYIQLAHVFVLSSLYEGFPTIVIESLLSGTPVLATDVAGIKEQLTKEEYGWIVENSQEALQEKMLEISWNLNLVKSYKLRLADYNYPNQRILDDYYAIFNGINKEQ